MTPLAVVHTGVAVTRPQVAPFHGVHDTRALMTNLAIEGGKDPFVRAEAERITRNLYGKDYLSEAAAIAYFLSDQRNVRYLRDPAKVELVKAPRVVLQTRQADCDDLACLGAALLHAVGIPDVRFALVGFKPDRLTHVLVEFRDPRSGTWVAVDPVAGPRTGAMLRRVAAFDVGPLIRYPVLLRKEALDVATQARQVRPLRRVGSQQVPQARRIRAA